MEIEAQDAELQSKQTIEGLKIGMKRKELDLKDDEIKSREILEGIKVGQKAASDNLDRIERSNNSKAKE